MYCSAQLQVPSYETGFYLSIFFILYAAHCMSLMPQQFGVKPVDATVAYSKVYPWVMARTLWWDGLQVF
jgi:hypothetical protein